MTIQLEAHAPIKLTPARFRVLSTLYREDDYVLSTRLSDLSRVVNVSLQISFLKDAGIKTVGEYVANPRTTDDLYLPPLKKYKLCRDSRGIAELSLTSYLKLNGNV